MVIEYIVMKMIKKSTRYFGLLFELPSPWPRLNFHSSNLKCIVSSPIFPKYTCVCYHYNHKLLVKPDWGHAFCKLRMCVELSNDV